ncbi:hypothetical protein H6P81_012701 [Aristolochia fimbriata]|uniref:Cytochrome P450 n=1 Tax=Aristolochia fimbriata TaxID=158543 RepID=A0AAV7ECM6_ARIFI|nr:hypothetical protein H6P81_012701 [Aristolochia fimbriata]
MVLVSVFFMLLLLLLLLLLPGFLLFHRKCKSGRSIEYCTLVLPPGPLRLPIIGNLHQVRDLTHRSLYSLSKQYGSLMFLKLGRRPLLVASSAEMAKEVMRSQDLQFCSRPTFVSQKKLSYNNRDIAFAPYSSRWREMRKISILELFSVKRVQSFSSIRNEELSKMITKISNACSDSLDLSDMLLTFTNHVVLRAAFGKSFDQGAGGVEEQKIKLHEALNEERILLTAFFFSDYLPLLGWMDVITGLRGRLKRNFIELDSFYEKIIQEHDLDPDRPAPEQEDFVDVLLRLERETNLDRDATKGTLMDVLLGGTDTSSATIDWAMSELMKNPAALKKAQKEVREIVKGEQHMVLETDLPKLRYLNAVIKETFRLHAPAPLLLPRETMEPCKIAGYDVPAKTTVIVNALAIGQDPALWKDPEEFKPERFEKSSVDYRGQDFELVPFGAGRRGCPGLYFGILNVEFALANLLYCFDWELPQGTSRDEIDMGESYGIVVQRRTPLHLVPNKYRTRGTCIFNSKQNKSGASTMSVLSLFFFLLLLLLLVPAFLLFDSKRRQSGRVVVLPPGPSQLPIIGNIHQLREVTHRTLWSLSKQYGPLMFLKLGRRPLLIVSSAEMAKEVMRSQDLQFCSRPTFVSQTKLTYNNRDIAFAPYGTRWREMRKISILEIFSTKRVQSFVSIRNEEISKMIRIISNASLRRKSVDLSEMLLTFTNDVVLRAAFGKSYPDVEQKINLHEAINEERLLLTSFFFSDYLPQLGWMDAVTGLRARLKKNFTDLDSFYEKVINEHLDPKRPAPELEDFVDVMLRLQQKLNLSRDDIKATLMNMLLGGTDTSSATVDWAMSELMKNPAAMKKAQKEVREIVQGEQCMVPETDLPKLQYLNAVIKETFRLHAPAPLLLPRETMEPCKIAGYDVPAKTTVMVNTLAIGQDPGSWKNPEEFKPERFEKSSVDYRGQDFELVPFGAGRRGCPGMYFGILNVELALANLLYCFDWELPEGTSRDQIDMGESCGLVVQRRTPLRLVPIKYQTGV